MRDRAKARLDRMGEEDEDARRSVQLSGAGEMTSDEFVHAETGWPRPAVGIMALEGEGAFARKEPAHRIDDEAFGAGRVGRKGVDDDAVAFAALFAAEPPAAFDP